MRVGRMPVPETPPDDVAAVVRRLAVLLEAGLTPVRAWDGLAQSGEPVGAAVAAGLERGEGVADLLLAQGGDWRPVALAWRVASTVGAPLAPALRAFAAALADGARSRDDVRVALAEPVATARLVGWLPLVAVALALAFGFDLAVVATHPVGIACVGGGLGLILLSRRWTARLVRRAQPPEALPGLEAEVLAIALRGGASLDRAVEVVAAAGGDPPDASMSRTLDLSRATGAPAVELLRAAADEQRHAARTEGRLRAARLGSKLLLPMGVCTLPAFLLLGVGPLLLSVLAGGVLTL
jgi:tight adherence protein B